MSFDLKDILLNTLNKKLILLYFSIAKANIKNHRIQDWQPCDGSLD